MRHSRKPGSPGKTTIPLRIVSAVTRRLLATFRRLGYDIDHDLFVIPQQCFLYVEVKGRPFGTR